MLLVMGNTNVSLILLLGKLHLGDNPRKGKAKNYPLHVNNGKKSKCAIAAKLCVFFLIFFSFSWWIVKQIFLAVKGSCYICINQSNMELIISEKTI